MSVVSAATSPQAKKTGNQGNLFAEILNVSHGEVDHMEHVSRSVSNILVESVWFVLGGTLKLMQFHPPAMGRDTFQYPTCSKHHPVRP